MANTTPPALPGSTEDHEDDDFDVADLDEAASPRRVGRYHLTGELGRGGMGVVYRARDPELGRDVAIKLVKNRASALAATRLLREAQAIARLAHPNVVAVHDVGSIHDQLYVAMELVRGSSLRHWLTRARRALPAVLDVFAQAARGLAAAHDAGLVHRDFKPDNVLVGDDGRVRVVDFGLARLAETDEVFRARSGADLAIDHSVTRAGAAVGTPRYMSPEQMLGADVDSRADQFSFCVALYEAVAQQRPYIAHDLDGLAAAIVAGELQPVPAASAVPAWLDRLLRRGLSAAPAARWASMHEIVDELVADRAGERNAALDGMGTTEPMIAAFPPRAGDVARVAVLRADLERAWGKKSRGDLAGALKAARTLLADTVALDYPPLRASALYLLGNLEHRTGDSLAARATLLAAAEVAARAGDDWQLANVWVFLVLVSSVGLHRHEEAAAFAACAEVALARTGHNPALQSRLDNHRGLGAAAAGHHDEAAAHHASAVLRDEHTHGPRHAFLVLSLLHLAEALLASGRTTDAAPPLVRAAEIMDLDADDRRATPSRARCLELLARLASAEGRDEAAAALTARADAVRARLHR